MANAAHINTLSDIQFVYTLSVLDSLLRQSVIYCLVRSYHNSLVYYLSVCVLYVAMYIVVCILRLQWPQLYVEAVNLFSWYNHYVCSEHNEAI